MPIRKFITVIALAVCTTSSSAQIAIPSLVADSTAPPKTPYTPGLKSFTQLVYISAWGPGAFAAVNYDLRLNGTNKGFGFRIGIGGVPASQDRFLKMNEKVLREYIRPAMISIPVGLNYVVGTGKHFMEFGMGVTYLSDDSLWYDEIATPHTWLWWWGMNYRRTIGRHLIMRLGLTHFISAGYVTPVPVPEWGMGIRF